MKPRLSLLLAGISCLGIALPALAARRPRYGGTLRIEIAAALSAFDIPKAGAKVEITSANILFAGLFDSPRAGDGSFAPHAGTAAFRILEWETGKHATLAANDGYSGGRPFVDGIEIQMGRNAKDRLIDLELDKTDLAEIPAEQARRAAQRGLRLSTSRLDELMAVLFVSGRPVAEDAQVREALARSIDRTSIANGILQKEGEPAGGLLPQWSSGTAFLFPTAADLPGSKELWSRIAGPPKILLGYDAGDGLEQTVAERIVVDAREAGIQVAIAGLAPGLSNSAKPDARLVRLRMSSPQPRTALQGFIAEIGPWTGMDWAPLPDPASPEQIYERESSIVSSHRIVPLVWLPQVYGLGSRVRDWQAPAPGQSWPLADVWLDALGTGSRSQ